MKTNPRNLIAISAILAISLSVFTPRATALPETTTFGTVQSPVGLPVVVTMASDTPATPEKHNGTLVAILSAWVIIKSGSSETWLPIAKVLSINLDR